MLKSPIRNRFKTSNKQTASHYKQNRRSCFSRKGDHERNEQSNHAQTIATFYELAHGAFDCKTNLLPVPWHLATYRLRHPKKSIAFLVCRATNSLLRSTSQFGRIELTEIALVNKGQKQVSTTKTFPETTKKGL